jgi:ribosome-associated protein
MTFEFNPEILHRELKFKAVRSSGKGGQHVNKVSSKVELYFDVKNSVYLSEEQRQRILEKLASKISNRGMLILDSQEDRSQRRNREIVKEKFDELIRRAFARKKARIKTNLLRLHLQSDWNRRKNNQTRNKTVADLHL